MFFNRQHAGRVLAEKVSVYLRHRKDVDWRNIIVVGLPRGGVPVAREVAEKLQAPLTILASKKIGAPGQPEFAIGAVSSTGTVVVDEELVPLRGKIGAYVQSESERLSRVTKDLEEEWLSASGLTRQSFADKTVVIVDDGIATGMTAIAAARSIRNAGARLTLLAAPVVAYQSLPALLQECNDVISLLTPRDLSAVGHYYSDFSPTEEVEMIDLLRSHRPDAEQPAP